MRRSLTILLAFGTMSLWAQAKPGRVADLPIIIDEDVIPVEVREFRMPFQFATDFGPNVRAVRLFVSENGGKSWKLVAEDKPTARHFQFQAPRDGLLWFAVQVIQADGKNQPPELKHLAAILKVYVNADKRRIESRAIPR
jgi:hypothetical protein